ncbi:C40 family peptidase [Lacrimispora sp. NSJ-141]|uniref:C40 family peptidase n=1 Tax=Lientehia hominis TaxID=2897778 RepID=A0AAP2W9T4_9FIRM|nr:SH3 domain-containing C40 family peptidase [Lientehia hominis]MCD2493691.1 C40 family peptidase [Lientehia hominis]
MSRTRKLIAAGCLCAAMTIGSTAYAMPGATSLVTVTPKTTAAASSNITEEKQDIKETGAVAGGAAALTVASKVSVATGTSGNDTGSTDKGQNSKDIKNTSDASQSQPAENTTNAADQPGTEAEPETVPVAEPSPYADVAVSRVGNDEDYVNIRDAASTEGEIVGKIYNNSAATIEETVEAEDGTWYKIHSGSVDGYIKADYFVTGDEAEALAIQIGKMFGYVEEGGLRVRTEPNTESEVITKLYSGETYTVLEEKDGFVKLSLGDDENGEAITGYVAEQYVDVYVKFDKAISLEEEKAKIEEEKRRAAEAQAAEEAAKKAEAAEAQSSTRSAVVAYAKQFIGNPYVWGGSSLTNGTDCSGFTKGVMAHFGVSISRTSRSQAGDGYQVSVNSVEPGDLIFYASGGSIYHVAIYIGGGKIVHAIDEAHGIGISSMYFTTPYCAVDVLG